MNAAWCCNHENLREEEGATDDGRLSWFMVGGIFCLVTIFVILTHRDLTARLRSRHTLTPASSSLTDQHNPPRTTAITTTTDTTTTIIMMKLLIVVILILYSTAVMALSASVNSPAAKANPVIKAAANGMGLLKPVFVAEAKLQAAVLGANVDKTQVSQEIVTETTKKTTKVVIYTYGLSPFSTEAVNLLDATGVSYTKIELGAEWFLLNGKDSVKRVLLSELVENGATSLPKVFVGGKCLGGLAELAEAVESGAFDKMVKGGGKKKPLFSFMQ